MGPLIAHRRWRYAFLAGITGLLLAAMALVGIGWVKVKMLPFDNKSEFQIILNMPEGSSLERTTEAAREIAAAIRTEPEVTDYQIYAGVASPFNFNGLVRHYFMRHGANVADLQINLVPKGERKAQSHDIAKRVRPRVAAIAAKYGARVAVAEVPPGPPVLQTLVAEIYGPTEKDRLALAQKVIDIFHQTPGVVDTDWYIEADQPKARFVIDKEKAALHGISAETISETLRIAVGGESVDLLHVPREKEDVNIVLQLPLASRTTPEELLALRVRSGDANALPEPESTTGVPPLVPMRELVTVEHTITDKSIYHKNLMPVTYVIGDVAGVVESPVYAILKMNQGSSSAARLGLSPRQTSSANGAHGAATGIKIYNAVQPFTDNIPAIKWDGEWHITIEVFRDLGTGVRGGAGADLHSDGRLVPVVPDAADCDGGDSLLAGRHSAGARRMARLLYRHFDDRLHGWRGNRGAQLDHSRGFHRTTAARRHAAGGSGRGRGRGALPANAVDGAGRGRGRERNFGRPDFPRPGHLADGGGNRVAAHQPHGRAGALLHGL